MRLELIMKQAETNGRPLTVHMNRSNGFLFIQGIKIFVGGYCNVTGPDETDNNELVLTLIYNPLSVQFGVLNGYSDKLRKIPDIIITEQKFSRDHYLHYLDFKFPCNAHVSHATYDLVSLEQK